MNDANDATLAAITPLILTYNEAPNIERTLAPLAWARRIVVIDSGSDDGTRDILARYPNVETHVRKFDTHADQWNFGLAQIGDGWVLGLDADYVLTDESLKEIGRLDLGDGVSGYESTFIYCVYGQRLRASLYPPRTVLFRRDRGDFYNEGHTQRLRLTGPVGRLSAPLLHDDRKPLSRWLSSQQNYARKEADFLLGLPKSALRPVQRLRLLGFVSPFLVFFYTLLAKGCLFEGWPGWFYVVQRTLAELMICAEIVDRRLLSRN